MYRVGIDIGSTATKVAVLAEGGLAETFLLPTGFNSATVADQVIAMLAAQGFAREDCRYGATGYGRVAVSYADRQITEISCHGRGANYLFGEDGVVIDVGGQDTKVIVVEGGKVAHFAMNDKCSAGTGKFFEVMANRLGVTHEAVATLAQQGEPTSISSFCTVFAESEVVSLIGQGVSRENIAYGVVESIAEKVASHVVKRPGARYFLTGGFCENAYLVERLQRHLGAPVRTLPLARFAGAIGAALYLEAEGAPQAKRVEAVSR